MGVLLQLLQLLQLAAPKLARGERALGGPRGESRLRGLVRSWNEHRGGMRLLAWTAARSHTPSSPTMDAALPCKKKALQEEFESNFSTLSSPLPRERIK